MPLTKKAPSLQRAGLAADSDSNLSSNAMTDTDSQRGTTTNSSTKLRRKRQHDDDLIVFMADMKKMFQDFKLQQEENLKKFQNSLFSTIEDIKKQNGEIRTSLEFLTKQYDEINLKIDKMEKDKRDYNMCIEKLEERIETFEKKLKASSLEIRNIPTRRAESKDDLLDLITKLSLTLKVPLGGADVRDVYRLNTKPEAIKPITIEFSTVILKEKFLLAFKNYNKEHRGSDRLSTKNLQLDGTAQPIFVSEALTFKCKKLFYQAREFAKANSYAFCWTSYGKVYLRKKEGAPFTYVKSEKSFERLMDGDSK